MGLLVVVTILMGALGWILGRPGVLRPPTVLASPSAGSEAARAGGGRDLSRSPERDVHAAHREARGE